MNYQEFKEQIVTDLEEALFEKGHSGIELSINHVEKMNESYDALTVRPEGSNIGANLKLDQYYDILVSGENYEEVVMHALQHIENCLKDMPAFDLNMITDYANVRNRLSIEVVSAERNAEILESVPHRLIEDMAIVYRVNLDLDAVGAGTVLVNNALLERYEITPKQLHEDAIQNAALIKPVVIVGMSQVLSDMMAPEEAKVMGVEAMREEEFFYVATVPDKTRGAGVLAYEHFMDCAAEKLGGDFYVIPSSVHEILLIKDDGNTSYSVLKDMVEEVNATQVEPEDKLTDSVYHYDSKSKIFELGEKFEERKSLEASRGKQKKRSVLKDLEEKKAQVKETSALSKQVEKAAFKDRGGEVL